MPNKKIKFRIKVDKRSMKQLRSMSAWVKHLFGPVFLNKYKKALERPGNLKALQDVVRAKIKTLIYDSYPENPKNYKRTGDLKRSFKVAGDPGSDGVNIAIYSDPAVAEATFTYWPNASYAIFFEDPVAYHSFIKPLMQRAPSNFRPYEQELLRLMQLFGEALGGPTMDHVVATTMPKILRT